MRKTILFGIIVFLLFLSVVLADTEVQVSVSSTEDINGYFDLTSGGDTSIFINGINYKGYVDYKVEQSGKGDMDRQEVSRTLELGWETFLGEVRHPLDYEVGIANVYFKLITHTLNYVHSTWILPIIIKQNAIIQTLEDAGLTEQYCKNLASEYFKAYDDESFKCEKNNMTYYRDLKFALQIKSVSNSVENESNSSPEFCNGIC